MRNPATEIAKLLLEIKAVTLNFEKPYQYTSGLTAPIYCDNRLLMSHPDKRQVILAAFLALIKEKSLPVDIIAGVATAGIPHAAWIADRLHLPMVYVRPESKKHGKQNQIEGQLLPGQTALVIEDLISTGKSALNATQALREAGATVTDCLAIFNYQFPKTTPTFQKSHLNLYTLTNFETLIETAEQIGYITPQEKAQALTWHHNL